MEQFKHISAGLQAYSDVFARLNPAVLIFGCEFNINRYKMYGYPRQRCLIFGQKAQLE